VFDFIMKFMVTLGCILVLLVLSLPLLIYYNENCDTCTMTYIQTKYSTSIKKYNTMCDYGIIYNNDTKILDIDNNPISCKYVYFTKTEYDSLRK